ncbi:TetR/AcrR family transcriptional regulator [Ramlibacter sp. 2FC]|uniref:TetR/AcrR family transcriptional regulator n=1 Tax=Ramlibacter sp. 2FC TaxID=2502188 RepID=UPI001485AE2B|nr:TetR/AcrR family transcriptional regulator [Ramlibacter sp. 2FC]
MKKPQQAAERPRRHRTQAERTQETQESLICSAIELLKKRRYAGLRTSDVAEHAGVSKGAATHHFQTKDSLVLRALEEMYRYTQQRALNRLASAGLATDKLLEAMVEDSKAFFLSDDFLLSLDLVMVAPDSELGAAVKELARAYRIPVEQAWIDALLRAGHRRQDAENVVRLTFAVARGSGIRQLIAGPEAAADSLMDTWLEMAGSMLRTTPITSPPQGLEET